MTMSDIKAQQQQQQQAVQQLEQHQQQQVQQQQQQQTIQVQLHDASQQMHAQAQVASSGSPMIPTSTMVMSGQQNMVMSGQQNMQGMQNMQSPPAIAPMPPQTNSTTITTMSTLGQQQQMTDWGHGRVQVMQPIQNPTYVQYNPQGQLIMPGNIALHPAGMNQGSIQVIAAGKPFQPGQMPHMLTAQGKPIVQGQATSFPTGYATIPTSGNNQTLVISPLGVQHLLPQQQQQQQQQKPDMQKMMAKTNGSAGTMKVASSQQQNVSMTNQQQSISSQAGTILQQHQIISPIQYTQQQRGVPQGATQAMQFAPWQPTFPTGLPQGLTWTPSAIQSPTALLTTQGNQIFIRSPQSDQNMFHIHNATQQAIPSHPSIQTQPMPKATQQVDMQPKAAIPKSFSNILPNSVGAPGSSVSTQTAHHQANMHSSQKAGNKMRAKAVTNRNVPNMAASKSDASNQTKAGGVSQNLQPKMNGQQTVAMQQDKMMRVTHAQVQAQVQQQVQQQIAAVQQQLQQQQMQMFHQQIQPKPGPTQGQMMMPGQLVGAPSTDNRPVMPVVSLPPGVQSPLMAPMVVHNVENIQGYQQQNLQMLASSIPMKSDESQSPMKEDGVQQTDVVPSGPGRPEDGSTTSESDVNSSTPATAISNNEEAVEESAVNAKSATSDKEGGSDRVEKTPAKAMVAVKPQVLTHVIEGFVIQESSEPFAVNRGAMEHLPRTPAPVPDEPPKKKQMMDSPDKQLAKCEMCGKVDLKSKFKQSKRFCSLSCSKSARVGLFSEDGARNDGEATEATGDNSSPTCNGDTPSQPEQPNETPAVNPIKWTVSEVCDFIRGLPGCAEYVDDFAMQEIDGQALMLLKADHLMSAMNIKLGPALKIVSKIDTMREEPPSPSAKCS